MILKEDNLYSSFSAELIHAILGNIPERMVPLFTKHLRRIFNEDDKIGKIDLKAACGAWLLQNRQLNFNDTKQLILNNKNWWIRYVTLSYVDKTFIGSPSYESILNQAIKNKSIDDSILASYLLATNGLRLTKPRSGLNKAAELLLKEFRIVARSTAVTCGIESALNTMLKTPILDINWKKILGGSYLDAEQKIIRTKGYFKTDPSAWVNIMDTFNDLLLNALFPHDGTIGTYQLGNIGGVLNSSSIFASKYPAIFKAVNDIHNKRLESDLSHPRHKKTGKTTKPIKHQYIPKASKLLYNAFIELKSKW